MPTFDFWACQRPLTKHWGSGDVWKRICKKFGQPDAAFGATDGIPQGTTAIDLNTGYDWKKLPFKDNKFAFGYWDPPYDHLYKKEGQKIWRTCQRLAILHTHIWPHAWLINAEREHGSNHNGTNEKNTLPTDIQEVLLNNLLLRFIS